MNLDARLLEKRGEATPDQLLRKLLHVDKDLSAKSNEGDYVVVSYTTRVENGTEKSYALTPVTPDGEVRYPSGSDETANRMVLGIVEGFQVEDAGKSGRMLDVVNPVAPFILTCKMAVRKGAAPKGTIQLESGHAAKAPRMPIFFLEPATTLGHQTRLIKTSTSKPREELDEHLRYRRGLHTPGTIVGASAHRTSRSGWY